MEINELLSKAWDEVEKANLPSTLNDVAFTEAIRLLSDNRTAPAPPAKAQPKAERSKRTASSPTRASRDRSASMTPERATTVSEDEFFDNIERETGVSRDKLERVIHFDPETPILNLPARSLGKTQKDKQIAIAQVLPVVRQYGLGEVDTPASTIRDECERLRCADRNLAKYLAELDGIVYTGPTRSRVLKVRGVEAFERAVEQLLGISTGIAEDE